MAEDKTKDKERDLVFRLKDGDHAAFQQLYLMYRKRIFFTAYSFIRSKEFAEDIYQDTFTVIWKIKEQLNPDASFSSFIYTIVRNNIFDKLRVVGRFERLPEFLLAEIPDHQSDIFRQVTTNEIQGLIKQEIDKLTRHQKKVFKMSREEDLSYQDIADNTGISVNRVNYLICGALKSIRLNLARYDVLSVFSIFCIAIITMSG